MKTLIPSLWVALFLMACSRKPANEVALISRNFSEEIELQQNLNFTFTHDLVTADMVGDWDSVSYFEIEPAVQGKFRWVSINELSFSPQSGFEKSTEYTLRFKPKLIRHAQEKGLYLGKELKNGIAFHTPYVKAGTFHAFWVKTEGTQNVKIEANLDFNYEVETTGLQALVQATIDDAPAALEVLSKGKTKRVVIQLDPGGKGETDVLVKIKLNPGIKLAGTSRESKDVQEMAEVLPSRLKLEIQDITTSFDNGRGSIRVLTSQELINTDLNACFTLEPGISTTTSLLPNGFEISGNFDISQVYSLTLRTVMEGVLGGKMKENYVKNISFGELQPSIAFANKRAIYLSSAGTKNIGVNIINVPKIKVRIYKIYQNNILSYLRHNSYREWEYYEEMEEYGEGDRRYYGDEDNLYSDLMLEKEIETSGLPKVNGQRVLNLDIPKENKNYKGIYFIQVSSVGERYLNASKLVSISDVGVIAKSMENKVLVMTHSILDAKTLANVEVNLLSTNNQVMATGKTGSDGVIVFDDLNKKAPGFVPAMITVQDDNDFNFVPFSDTRVETSRFDVGGKYLHASGFDAYVYGPRNLYRPGEKVHLHTILRTNKWESASEIPLKLKMVMPNGRELKTERVKTNRQGAVGTTIDLPASALTGNYSFEVYNGNDALLTSYSIQVEEFMPDRIRIKPGLNKERYQVGDTIRYNVFAENFFGPPAAERNYEVTAQYQRRNFKSKTFPDHSFYNSDQTQYSTIVRQGTTDEKGTFREDFELPLSMKGTGIVDVKLYTTVFDESGRPVHALRQSEVHTQKVYYGVNMEEYYVKTQAPVQISLVAVDQNDKFRAGSKAVVEVYRYEWQNVIENSNSYYSYRSKKVEKLVLTKNVQFGSSAYSLPYTPLVSGQYEVRIREAGSPSYVSYDFYAYGWGNTESGSFEVNSEGQIDIQTDKEKYEVGDRVKVLLKTPFAGKLLISIERDNVLEYKVMETDKKSAEFTFTLKDAHVPNVYVSATLFRPMSESGMPLTVAHGFAPVMVEKKASHLPLEIVAAEKTRSRSKQKITVRSRPESDIEVTLAIVDEGILQLKNFQSPDPHKHFYQKRALEVGSYDLYAYLFPELNSKKSSGGDAENLKEGGDKRANPLANNRVKLLSVWSGVLKTNAKGEATYEVDIPQFNGEVRIMAVAYKGSAFGATSKSMKIADPMVINTALPRFLSPSDEVELPVHLANTTGKNAQAKIEVRVSGQLELVGAATGSADVGAGKEAKTRFVLRAKQAIGQGKITVWVKAMGETFKEELDITIRPSAPLTRNTSNGALKAGNHTLVLDGYNELIPESRSVHILVSRSPVVQFMDKFQYLVGYPHGCMEQTVSKAFPQIYLAEFIKNNANYLKVTGDNELNPEYNVRAAIEKLSSMQLYNGAMSYWPGAYNENYWGTAYATHFLLEAKKAGYEVNTEVLNRCLDYLNYRNSSYITETVWYFNNGQWQSREIINRSQIYGLYILAKAGRVNRSLMNQLKAKTDLLSTDEKYLLGAAYALSGDMNTFKNLAPVGFPKENTRSEFGGNFASDMRNLAISLQTLIEVDPGNKQIPGLARLLSQELQAQRYTNTQELVFSLLALGKLNRSTAGDKTTALVKYNGEIIGRFDGTRDLRISPKELSGGKITMDVTGSGYLYYFTEVSGINSHGKFKEEDNFLRVRRTFYNRFGQPVTTGKFKQNDLIVVKVSVSSLNNMHIENVAITDMLPAGFEIENPRLNDLPGMDWIKNRHSPEYYDFRDDRVNLYAGVGGDEQHYYFLVRAVSKGKFMMGPIGADAMYNGEYHSYHGGGVIQVE